MKREKPDLKDLLILTSTADGVAEVGRLIIPKVQKAISSRAIDGRRQGRRMRHKRRFGSNTR